MPPVTSYCTVAVSPDSTPSDTGRLTGDTDSAPLVAASSKATAGGSSLSSMVYVWVTVPPRVAFSGSVSVIMRVSSFSSMTSLVTATVMLWVVSPGA